MKFEILSHHIDKNGILQASVVPQGSIEVTFHVSAARKIKSIEGFFPDSLEEINFFQSINLEIFDTACLPKNLKKFKLGFSGIREIKGQFPASVEKIKIIGSRNLKVFDANCLQEGINKVDISNASGISEIIGKFPKSLRKLDISRWDYTLESFDASCLQEGLRKFTFGGWKFLTEKISGQFPTSLREIKLVGCRKNENLDLSFLPQGLEIFHLEQCSTVNLCGKFPASLKIFTIDNCKNLKTFNAEVLQGKVEILDFSRSSIQQVITDTEQGLKFTKDAVITLTEKQPTSPLDLEKKEVQKAPIDPGKDQENEGGGVISS